MYITNSDFITEWKNEAVLTQKALDSLTDESLQQQVYPEGRTLGRIACLIIEDRLTFLCVKRGCVYLRYMVLRRKFGCKWE